MNNGFTGAAVLALMIIAGAAWSQGEQDAGAQRNLRATITGNQEQPNVLYIVPWKAAQNEGAIPYRPIRGQTDRVFRHIERSEHLRHLEFLDELAEAE